MTMIARLDNIALRAFRNFAFFCAICFLRVFHF